MMPLDEISMPRHCEMKPPFLVTTRKSVRALRPTRCCMTRTSGDSQMVWHGYHVGQVLTPTYLQFDKWRGQNLASAPPHAVKSARHDESATSKAWASDPAALCNRRHSGRSAAPRAFGKRGGAAACSPREAT